MSTYTWVLQAVALVVSATVAGVQVRKAIMERREERRLAAERARRETEDQTKARAERDAIIMTSAQTAVTVLERALHDRDEDNAQLRNQVMEIKAREAQMERTLRETQLEAARDRETARTREAALEAQVRACYERIAQLEDRLSSRDS